MNPEARSPALGRSLRFAAEVARMTCETAMDLTGNSGPEDRAEVADRLQASLDGLHRLLREAEPMAEQLPDSGAAVGFAAEVAGMTLDRVPRLLTDLDKDSLLELADCLQATLAGLHRLLSARQSEAVDALRFGAFVAEMALDSLLKLDGPADCATRAALADRLELTVSGLYLLLRDMKAAAAQLPTASAFRFGAALALMTLDHVGLFRGEIDDESQAEVADSLQASLAGLHRLLRDAGEEALNAPRTPRAALSGVEADRPTLRDPVPGLAAVA
ncbi:MAG: hypothetical protein MUE46_05885 [Xanthomonadales bacterium]|jgi:hypothetical protein|nr:hypothetical protein [Xanthomonadales bacterium]